VEIAAKLQLKTAQGIRVVDAPADLALELPMSDQSSAGAILVFVRSTDQLTRRLNDVRNAALADRLTWVAYPKAGRLGTDLNRDRLAVLLEGAGIRPVRQVALDETWSALRLRPRTRGAPTA